MKTERHTDRPRDLDIEASSKSLKMQKYDVYKSVRAEDISRSYLTDRIKLERFELQISKYSRAFIIVASNEAK